MMCTCIPRTAYRYSNSNSSPRYAKTQPARSGIDSVQLSQHFKPASDRDRVSPAESAFLVPCDNAMMIMMMIWDFKREGDAFFRHLQGSQGRVLTPRDATEAPTQRSRSPLSPTEVTELATVRLFLILSACALLCSLRPGFCIVCDFAHARPIILQHPAKYQNLQKRKQSSLWMRPTRSTRSTDRLHSIT